MSSALPETTLLPDLWSVTVRVSFAASLGTITDGVFDEDGAELLCGFDELELLLDEEDELLCCGLDELLDEEAELLCGGLDEDELLEEAELLCGGFDEDELLCGLDEDELGGVTELLGVTEETGALDELGALLTFFTRSLGL